MKYQAIKGVRDILPPESALWNRVEQTAREVFATYGYGEIRLPVFEETELYARSVGAETDIVNKEMYSVVDEDRAWLEGFRRRLVSVRIGDLADQSALVNYLGQLDLYVGFLRSAVGQGEVPWTEGNESHLRVLTEQSKARGDWQRVRPPESDLSKYIGSMTAHLRGLDFGPSMSLRPEATASVCRAYIEHGMHTLPGNVKLYYIGPMFRRERPQKGRYRQFYQIGAEVLGQSDAPAIDAEVIEMLMAFFDRCGLVGYSTHVNSIGCKECRPKYVEKLRAALVEHINELKADSQRRVETNPLRVLDSKLPEEQAVIEKLPRITDHLCAACREHYAEVKKQLALRGVFFLENWRLVRGLDYYMRTTFEITAPGLGAQNAVCGGGRYDGLVELLGGPPTKGIGFAIGTDRLILALQERDKKLKAEVRKDDTVDVTGVPLKAEVGKVKVEVGVDVFVAWMGAASQPAAVKIARTLREAGFSVEVPAEEMKFKKSIGLADKLSARYALIIGEDEVRSGQYTLKLLSDGTQTKHAVDELVAAIKKSG